MSSPSNMGIMSGVIIHRACTIAPPGLSHWPASLNIELCQRGIHLAYESRCTGRPYDIKPRPSVRLPHHKGRPILSPSRPLLARVARATAITHRETYQRIPSGSGEIPRYRCAYLGTDGTALRFPVWKSLLGSISYVMAFPHWWVPTELLQRPSHPHGLLVDPFPTFGLVCLKEESLHVFDDSVQPAKLLLLERVRRMLTRKAKGRLTSLSMTRSSSEIDFSISLSWGPTMRDCGCLDIGTNARRLLDKDLKAAWRTGFGEACVLEIGPCVDQGFCGFGTIDAHDVVPCFCNFSNFL